MNSDYPLHAMQRFCASVALFLLPFPALNFGVSFTFADVFLVLAVLLNAGELLKLRPFQVPFLLAMPLFVLSAFLDPDGGLIELVQVLYIWGFVFPFGWAAFTRLPIRHIVGVILVSAVINAAIATGQGAGYLPELGNQHVIEFGGGFSRAAGLSLKCNSLVMSLTPCVLLVPCLTRVVARVGVLVALVFGLLAAVSKSVIFAVPGIVWYLWHEPRRKQVVVGLLVLVLSWPLVTGGTGALGDLWYRFSDLVTKRFERMEGSVDERVELMRISLDHASDTLLVGYGPAGAHVRVSEMTTNVVHVYYLGVLLAGGLPALLLVLLGMSMICAGLWRQGRRHVALYVLSHLLSLTVMTALLVSFQALPLLVGGAILAQLAHAGAGNEVQRAVLGPRLRVDKTLAWTGPR